MKAILLSRVSSREQENGVSIESQVQRLQHYAETKGFDVISTYSITEQSSKGGKRKKFNEIVRQIKESSTKIALVSDSSDRLLRNFKDSIVIDALRIEEKVELHFLRENLILTATSTSSELLQWDITILFSKSYIASMTENILRSMKYQVRNRKVITLAPIGYLNKGKGRVEIDPDRAPLVKKMFELYSTGDYSIPKLYDFLDKAGLRSRYGIPVSVTTIHKMFKNASYYGIWSAFGESYVPDVPAIISYELFKKCEMVMEESCNNHLKSSGKSYLYKKILRCGKCGCFLTFEEKKKIHIYGHCVVCKKTRQAFSYVKEGDISKEVESCLRKIMLPEKTYKAVTDSLRKYYDEGKTLGGYCLYEDRTSLEEIRSRIQRLVDGYISGIIDQPTYLTSMRNLQQSQASAEERLNSSAQKRNPYESLLKLLEIAQNGLRIFQNGDAGMKKEIMRLLFREAKLNDKSVEISERYPLGMIGSSGNNKTGGAVEVSQTPSGKPFSPGGTGQVSQGTALLKLDMNNPEWVETVQALDMFELRMGKEFLTP